MSWLKRVRNPESREEKSSRNQLPLELRVNGKPRTLRVGKRQNLLQVLRNEFGLLRFPGDCGRGECGGCLVLVDDEPRIACTTSAVEVQGRSILTAEGLLESEPPSTVPTAFEDHEVFLCGSCTSGQMMAAEGLLRADPKPSPRSIIKAMSAVECRCGGQHLIYAAVEKAAELRRQRNSPTS